MEDGATALTANYAINVLTEAKMFEDKTISHRLWPKRYPDLNPCDICLWENLKNKMYSNNPHALDGT
jgi:hypothetical protein